MFLFSSYLLDFLSYQTNFYGKSKALDYLLLATLIQIEFVLAFITKSP